MMDPGPLDPLVLHGQLTHRSFHACTCVELKELHTSNLSSTPSNDISPLHMEDTHIRHVEVPFTPYGIPLVASSSQPLEAMSNTEESVFIVCNTPKCIIVVFILV